MDRRLLDRLPHLDDDDANPLRSEAEAFRFLIASIGYFGAIVVAAVEVDTWVGLGVFVVADAPCVGWSLHARRDERAAADASPVRTRPASGASS